MKIINDKKAFDAYFKAVKQRVKRHEEEMDTITTKVVRLKIAKGCRHTSAMERLWRAFRGKDSLNKLGHLLCTV